MDEDEIDGWYEDEKQKLLEEFLKQIEDSKDHSQAEKKYEARLSKLMQKYNRMMEEKLQQKNKQPSAISKIKDKISFGRK